jgi:hypothetical protein
MKRTKWIAVAAAAAMISGLVVPGQAEAGRKGDKIAIGVAAFTIGALLANQSARSSNSRVTYVTHDYDRHDSWKERRMKQKMRRMMRRHNHMYHGVNVITPTVVAAQPTYVSSTPTYVIQQPVVESQPQCVPYEGFVNVDGQRRKVSTVLCPSDEIQ